MICPYNRKSEVQKLRWKQAVTQREEDGADVTDLTQFCTTDIEMTECPKDGCGAGQNGRCCYAAVNLNNL